MIVEKIVIAYRPIPPALTLPLTPPLTPLPRCVDSAGRPSVCVLDALLQVPAYQALIGICNADRARVALLGSTDAIQ